MTKGRYYVEAIDLLLDTELHRIQQVRDEKIAKAIFSIVEPFGINPHSRRLSGAFRSTKTSPQVTTEIDRVRVFQERFPELKHLDDQRLIQLIRELEELMSPIDTRLYSERTKLSTISGVIRPLSTKWLERWRAIRITGFDYEGAVKTVNELLEEDIPNLEVAEIWLQKVYDLFSEFVIFRPNRNDVGRISERRPIGMVGENNERIYRRNWAEFKQLHLATLQANAAELAAGKRPSGYAFSYRSQAVQGSLDIPPASASYQAVPEYAPNNPIGSAQVITYAITIESADAGGGSASKKWSSKSQLESDIEPWIRKMISAWGASDSQINITLDVSGSTDDFNAKIPNKTPGEGAQAIKSLIE